MFSLFKLRVSYSKSVKDHLCFHLFLLLCLYTIFQTVFESIMQDYAREASVDSFPYREDLRLKFRRVNKVSLAVYAEVHKPSFGGCVPCSEK